MCFIFWTFNSNKEVKQGKTRGKKNANIFSWDEKLVNIPTQTTGCES